MRFKSILYIFVFGAFLVPPAIAQSTFRCDSGKPASGAIVDVKGSGHELRAGPNDKADRIVNVKATSILGRTQYHSIDSSTQVQLQCENGDWVRVQITKPDWLTHVSGWVRREPLALPRVSGEARTFTADDIYWWGTAKLHKSMIVAAINRIHREDPRCKEDIEVNSIADSPTQSKPGKPVFFVPCGKGVNAVNVYFSAEDVASGKPFVAPGHIEKGAAINLCESYAKQQTTHPSTVAFSRFADLAVTEHANGRTAVMSSFTAKNAFNLKLNFNIRCLLDEKGLIEATISETR